MAEIKRVTEMKTVMGDKNTILAEVNSVVAEVSGENDEIEVFGRSCTKRRKFVIIQQIENFSLHFDHGVYVSPTYYDKCADCKWSLIITKNNEDNIKISLEHNEYKGKHLAVDVHLTVVDSFGLSSFYSFKKIDFHFLFPYEILMQIPAKELMYGYSGLNRKRFLPNDTLTLKCEITADKTFEKISVKKEKRSEKEEIPKNRIRKEVFLWLIMLFMKCCSYVSLLGLVGYIALYIATPYIESAFVKPLIKSNFSNILYENLLRKPLSTRINPNFLLESSFSTAFMENILSTPLIKNIPPLPFSFPNYSYLLSAGIACLSAFKLLKMFRKFISYLLNALKPGGDRTYQSTK